MNPLTKTLAGIDAELGAAVRVACDGHGLHGVDDDALMDAAAMAARLQRRIEGLLIEISGEVQERTDARERGARITERYGCRSAGELMQRATLASPQTVNTHLRVAHGIHRDVALSTGEMLPAALPALRQAMLEGAVGADALHAVSSTLTTLRANAGAAAALTAEAELARAACGDDETVPLGAQDLKGLAHVLVAYLDPDGAEPRRDAALRRRGFALGVPRDGVVPVRGNLLPEVAAQLERIFDSQLNPKGDGVPGPRFVPEPGDGLVANGAGGGSSDGGADGDTEPAPADTRTRAQRQHDAFAATLSVAARSGELPTIGGAAPTLVVGVRADDFASGRGFATVEGCDEPVSISVARHTACGGDVQRVVFGDDGRIVHLGVRDRVFNHHQRKAIALRDGGCVIPGCHVRAAWCEVHHVTEHARGGPTHTNNGVLLCWWHHRNLESGTWAVRMNGGTPEVRGPAWWDPHVRWRPVTKSHLRQLEGLAPPA